MHEECPLCGLTDDCRCGMGDYYKTIRDDRKRLRAVELELRGAMMFASIVCKRAGGEYRLPPSDYVTLPAAAILHRHKEVDGTIVYRTIGAWDCSHAQPEREGE